METQHVFKSGDTAYTIWREEVKLISNPESRKFPLFVKVGAHHLSVTEQGFYLTGDNPEESPTHKIIYPYPVRVTPIPEFEEGEEIEVKDFNAEYCDWSKRNFLYKDSTGKYWCLSRNASGNSEASWWKFARKITKPEKTTEELKADLIQLQEMLIVLFEAWFNNREGINEHDLKLLKDKISSLQEQIKQKS